MKKTPGRTTAEKVKYWTRHIEAARKYPNGVTAYCRDHGLEKNNYYQWFRRLRAMHPEWEDLNNTISGTKPTAENRSTETSAKSTRRVFSRSYQARIIAESGKLAKKLFQETCSREKIDPNQPSVHSDSGTAMTSITLALLFANLGILKSLSSPRVSNDNAFVESLFKTLKFRHIYPERFADIAFARAYLEKFFDWYNYEHFHSGIALLTPHTVHAGLVQKVCARRQRALDRAYAAHPERYVKGRPVVAMPADEVWLNKPEFEQLSKIA